MNGLLCNFWRAVKFDPEQTAHWAQWPTVHLDLTARHKWLVEWGSGNVDALREDPEYYDAKVAGWWCWGVSNWIGGGFCDAVEPHDKRPSIQPKKGGGRGISAQRKGLAHDQIPHVKNVDGGSGVQAQRKGLVHDKIPHVKHKPGGQGIQPQRKQVEHDQRPHVKVNPGGQGIQAQRTDLVHDKIPIVQVNSGGRGVQAQRKDIIHDKIPIVQVRAGGRGVSAQREISVSEWFEALSARLYKTVILNRDWKSGTSPSILGNTASYRGIAAVFLDPPYLTSDRANLYRSDTDGTSDRAAREAYEWAVEHGEEYRVAYACHEGDFPVPEGWDAETTSFKGVRNERERQERDMVMFSPACHPKGGRKKGGGALDRFF